MIKSTKQDIVKKLLSEEEYREILDKEPLGEVSRPNFGSCGCKENNMKNYGKWCTKCLWRRHKLKLSTKLGQSQQLPSPLSVQIPEAPKATFIEAPKMQYGNILIAPTTLPTPEIRTSFGSALPWWGENSAKSDDSNRSFKFGIAVPVAEDPVPEIQVLGDNRPVQGNAHGHGHGHRRTQSGLPDAGIPRGTGGDYVYVWLMSRLEECDNG
ncbi:hypothetical protein BZA77DRAFT_293292 [Pyronema omphalodes]|nr:hypothetical protein BZA77DRAFT_293292 [Pyronema omphalodes]